MVSLDTFLLGLLITSTLTGLATEAIKTLMSEHNVSYYSNTLAGIVSAVLSGCVGVGYVVFSGSAFTTQIVLCIIALIFASWLCSMVGYDKVIQAISQFKTNKEE